MSEKQILQWEQLQLDLIIEVSEAYLNILRAQINLRVQQKNVEVTQENFNIATPKHEIGYAGASDLHRWEAELASNNIDLNAVYAAVQQAQFRLNQLLNRSINEPFYHEGTCYLVYSKVRSLDGVWKDTPNFLVTTYDILGSRTEFYGQTTYS